MTRFPCFAFSWYRLPRGPCGLVPESRKRSWWWYMVDQRLHTWAMLSFFILSSLPTLRAVVDALVPFLIEPVLRLFFLVLRYSSLRFSINSPLVVNHFLQLLSSLILIPSVSLLFGNVHLLHHRLEARSSAESSSFETSVTQAVSMVQLHGSLVVLSLCRLSLNSPTLVGTYELTFCCSPSAHAALLFAFGIINLTPTFRKSVLSSNC